MRLFDKSFWSFVGHTGRIPVAPPTTELDNPQVPLALKVLSVLFTSPGADVLDPAAITRKVEANRIDVPKPVLSMVPLQPQRIVSDAMGVPQALISPVHQTIATYLKGGA